MRAARLVLKAFPIALAILLAAQPASAAAQHPDDHTDPGFSMSFFFFPTHEQVIADLDQYQDYPWVELVDLGVSGEGRPLRLAIVTDPASPTPMEERVRTFIFTQQHGNEPAGTPAALQLLKDITSGAPIAKTLSDQVLLLLPMVNPDGATANQRGNAKAVDINRDHIALETPEANLVHRVLNAYDPHVAMDHHEYSGTGLGNPSPVRVYDYDLTTLFPVHGNVRLPVRAAAEDLMYEGLWPRAAEAGFTANEYGEQTAAGIPITYVAGGPDPGIMRNHIGLHNMAGLLVETRVDAHPNPFHDATRRTAIHSVVMEATLEYVHENAQVFRDAKAEGARLNVEEPMDVYLEGEQAKPLGAAYRTPADATLDALFAAHAIALGIPVDGGVVHNMADPLQGHIAAMVHPDSSRKVVDGVATEPAAVPEEVEAPKKVKESPAAVAAPALLALALVALLRRR